MPLLPPGLRGRECPCSLWVLAGANGLLRLEPSLRHRRRPRIGYTIALMAGGSCIFLQMRLAPQETRTYLVTAVTAQRRRLFQVTANAELFRQTLLDYRGQGRFSLHAYVVMPDHFHALITPAAEVSLEKAVQFIKGGFSFRLKSKMDVWMRSFNESQISTADKFAGCVRYVEENPVRARLVSGAEAYVFSSAGQEGLDPMPAHFRG
jgi:putative transposase